ncbi:hypothetical protein AB0K60_28365 [Thermopolyspora sp. NPDC052614]|uniref:hypothetical protein n=1 Tax=Thermopolyspora sp. NPDC052614 TaxID=3155682 RepID=UPI003445192D
MRRLSRLAMAGMLTAAIGGAGLLTASPAHAYTYELQIWNKAFFTADFCLTRQNYDNHNDAAYTCTGDVLNEQGRTIRLDGVSDRYRVYLDIWVRGGRTAKQITILNGHQERVGRYVSNTKYCQVDGIITSWTLTCDGEVFYKH